MIHEVVFYAASVWVAGLIIACAVLVLRARSAASRIVALDMLVLLVIALLVLWSDAEGVPYFLDAALLLALLAFMGTLAAARFHGGGRLF
ncbi:MAG TPA: monovalent cation/H+ antiporter complex subunit F [Solirubrobacterales bacterium]|nr:monovalent cation/H+ antiporter complex subunit F [Solirubrobacterales bacterium]